MKNNMKNNKYKKLTGKEALKVYNTFNSKGINITNPVWPYKKDGK